ncbi:MAG: HypC/HybG/HupF family hydrogenase formation chaperone [Myxococcales bacterium]|nr:HypC/HybG/HupF family hydrogenase formation chaperone [Myxococcales bacterium]
MCLAVPMKVLSRQGEMGAVEQAGVRREVSFAMLPEAAVGDFVLIHAGFAIQRLDEEEARSTLDLIRQIAAAGEDGG